MGAYWGVNFTFPLVNLLVGHLQSSGYEVELHYNVKRASHIFEASKQNMHIGLQLEIQTKDRENHLALMAIVKAKWLPGLNQ